MGVYIYNNSSKYTLNNCIELYVKYVPTKLIQREKNNNNKNSNLVTEVNNKVELT